VEAILRRWSYAGETVLPDDPAPLHRVAVRCGFKNADEFMRAVGTWRAAIREVYTGVFQLKAPKAGATSEPDPSPRRSDV
jgi:glutamine synthetase adenylyltransferase